MFAGLLVKNNGGIKMGECCEESKCCSGESSCCESSCNDSCCESEMSKGKMILGLANEAWSELMKEKMKAAYEKTIGEKMNKAAHVGVEACIAYWAQKMKSEAAWAEFEEKLSKAMM